MIIPEVFDYPRARGISTGLCRRDCMPLDSQGCSHHCACTHELQGKAAPSKSTILINNSSKSVVAFFLFFYLFIFIYVFIYCYYFLQFWCFPLKKEPLRAYVSFKYYAIGNSILLPSNIAGNKFFTFRSVNWIAKCGLSNSTRIGAVWFPRFILEGVFAHNLLTGLQEIPYSNRWEILIVISHWSKRERTGQIVGLLEKVKTLNDATWLIYLNKV